MKRGYWGIGIYGCKTSENIGTLWRSAHAFGADFIFTVGHRYRKQASDTTKAERHVPFFEFSSLDAFENGKPRGCATVCVELSPTSRPLVAFNHPERAAYILGAEDYGLPEAYMVGKQRVMVEAAARCLNVAVAGSIVAWARVVAA